MAMELTSQRYVGSQHLCSLFRALFRQCRLACLVTRLGIIVLMALELEAVYRF